MNINLGAKILRGNDPAQLRPYLGRPLMAALGKRLEFELRAHFLLRNATPNKKNWPRSNFWSKRIRNATQFTEATETVATVTVADPAFVQKLYGGTITPKQAKYLALPARAEASGRSPRLFDDLIFIALKRGDLAGMLVKKGDQGGPFYFLLKKVTQAADADALPKEADTERGLLEEVDDFVELAKQREGLA